MGKTQLRGQRAGQRAPGLGWGSAGHEGKGHARAGTRPYLDGSSGHAPACMCQNSELHVNKSDSHCTSIFKSAFRELWVKCEHGYIFDVKLPALDHYIVVLKENILDFKICEEVFTGRMSCNLLSNRSGKKAYIYSKSLKANVVKKMTTEYG